MATITFSESNGAGEVVTDSLSNINFGNADEPNTVVANHKITVGNNSYEKYIRIKVDLDSGTVIENMKFWKSAGTLVTGETIKAIANQIYSTPVATASSKAVSDIPTSEGTALDIESEEVDDSKFTEDGYSKYLVLQTQSTESTPGGAGNQKTFTLQYDES
jgi:hypothetical protein